MLSEYVASALIALVAILIVPTFLLNCVVYMLSLKYKFKIKFKFKQFHLQLCSLEIANFNETNEQGDRLFEIYIDKIWVSSCYLNRQVNSRVNLNFNNVRVKYYQSASSGSSPKKNKTHWSFYSLIQFYLKYIGSLTIANLNLKYFGLVNNETTLNLSSVKIELNEQDESIKFDFNFLIEFNI